MNRSFLYSTLALSLVASTALADTLIDNVTVITSKQTPFISDVLIKDGTIVRIAPAIEKSTHHVIQGDGKFLIPGLIDSHVHLGSTGGMREDLAESNPDLLKQFREQEPKSYLYFGFTSVVDLKQSETFAEKWQSLTVKPNLTYCKGLPLANGYGMAFLPEKAKFSNPYFIYNHEQSKTLEKDVELSGHDAQSVITKVAQTGANCVKTHHESGFGGLWDWPTPDDQLLASISKLAKDNSLVHTHHGNSLSAYRQASTLNIDVMAHGLWHWEEENSSDILPRSIQEILDQLIEKGTAIQTTSQVLYGELRVLDEAFLNDPLLKHSLPPALVKWHQQGNSLWFNKRMEKIIKDNPDVVEKFLGRKPTGEKGETTLAGIDRLNRVTRYLHKKGATFLFASDSPSSPTYTNPPGYNGLLELMSSYELGMSLRTIFESATVNNARAFNMKGKGEIIEGFDADLLLLNQNPLESVEAYNAIELVILGGQILDRASLAASSL